VREIVTIFVLLGALLATGHGAVLGAEVVMADGSPMGDFDGSAGSAGPLCTSFCIDNDGYSLDDQQTTSLSRCTSHWRAFACVGATLRRTRENSTEWLLTTGGLADTMRRPNPLVWRCAMSEREKFSMRTVDNPSVYALTDRQLAEEYRRLTGSTVEVPSRRSPGSWWEWRCDLQTKVMQERLQPRSW
jgi:hypothetical protein